MRWPWSFKQTETKTAGGCAPSTPGMTAAELGSRCEECGEHALVCLNGQHVLCWAHYCAAMRRVHDGN